MFYRDTSESLLDWAIKNCMKFHPSKCKSLMVSILKMPLLNVVPFIQFHYSMDRELVDYCEKDLGIDINGSLHFNFQSDMLYSKANQRLGFLKRTCHFVKNSEFKMALF